jgi:hypothetical protein
VKHFPNFAGMVDAEVYGMANSSSEFADMAKHIYELRYSLSAVIKAELTLRDALTALTPEQLDQAITAAEKYFTTYGTAPIVRSAFLRKLLEAGK